MFCPVCGKKSNGFCENCKPIEELKAKDILIKICSNCGKFFKNNKWNSYNFEEGIINIAKDKIKDNVEIDLSNLDLEELNQKKPGLKKEIELNVYKENNFFIIPAKIFYTYCDKCSKSKSYFEGTLQIRNLNDEILNYINKYIEKNNLTIAKKTQIEKGIDIQLSDQKKIQNLAHHLKNNFGGILKISNRQFTQDKLTSKQIYRINALYEAPEYKKGDVLKIENNIYYLTNVERDISAIDLKTGKKTTITRLINKKQNYQIIPEQKTKITKIYPDLEIMDPETYQSAPVINKLNVQLKIGENVKVICDDSIYYIIN
ncbi:MAG: NMD3-related protein [Candidatus Woesearchaeota archaeon]